MTRCRRGRAGSPPAPPARAARRCGPRARPCGGRAPRPCACCGWCSRSGSARSARRAGRRRRGRTAARPCRSSPSRRCGTAGAGTRAGARRSTSSLRVAQRPHAVAGHARARPPRGGGTTRPAVAIERVLGLPTSCSSAARRTIAVRAGLGHHGDRVGQHVLVAVDRILLEAHRRQLGEELVGQTGVDDEPQAGGRVVDHEQLVELVADALGRHDLEPLRHRRDRRRPARASASRPKPAMNRAARSMRSGSSLNDTSGDERRAQPPGGQVADAAERIDQLGARAARAPWR